MLNIINPTLETFLTNVIYIPWFMILYKFKEDNMTISGEEIEQTINQKATTLYKK